jgi:N-acetylglucosamine kinase-like BadF-type ATPase
LLKDELIKIFGVKHVIVENDCIGAMRAGTDAKNCGVICLGSGPNIALQKDTEKFVYGYYLMDGYLGAGAMGAQAYASVIRAHTGVATPTSLTAPVLEYTGFKTPDELLFAVTMKKASVDFKELSPFVYREAVSGDAVALSLAEKAAKGSVTAITARAEMMGIDLNGFELVLSGGVFKGHGYILADMIKKELSVYPGLKITEGRYEPVAGAALLWADTLYNELPEQVRINIEESCKRLSLIRK